MNAALVTPVASPGRFDDPQRPNDPFPKRQPPPGRPQLFGGRDQKVPRQDC
jgi:hypothetical protein